MTTKISEEDQLKIDKANFAIASIVARDKLVRFANALLSLSIQLGSVPKTKQEIEEKISICKSITLFISKLADELCAEIESGEDISGPSKMGDI